MWHRSTYTAGQGGSTMVVSPKDGVIRVAGFEVGEGGIGKVRGRVGGGKGGRGACLVTVWSCLHSTIMSVVRVCA
jgi:hypothetical protein